MSPISPQLTSPQLSGALQPVAPGLYPLAKLGDESVASVRALTQDNPAHDPIPYQMWTPDGTAQISGDPTNQRIEFNRVRYLITPPIEGRFYNPDDSIPTHVPTAIITAQTRIEGNIVHNPLLEFNSIKAHAERNIIQAIQRQCFTTLDACAGMPINNATMNYVHNQFTAAITAVTANDYQIINDGTWQITTTGTTGTNTINMPNGIRVVQMRQEFEANGGIRIIVDAQVDNVFLETFQQNQQQNLVAQLRSIMKSNLLIKIAKKSTRRQMLDTTAVQISSQELKARETLRDMITESEYRRYITNGFIMVKGQSGIWYQIFNPNRGNPRSYKDGKPFETICIHTDAACPPTDHVINCKVLAEIDEDAFRKGANVSIANNNHPGAIQYNTDGSLKEFEKYKLNYDPEKENLVQKFKRLKAA